MLTKASVIDKIEVDQFGHVFVRTASVILEDGEPVSSPTYHRESLEPGSSLDGKDSRVAAIAAAVWTPDVIKAHRAAQLE